jgi:hypothetical protein
MRLRSRAVLVLYFIPPGLVVLVVHVCIAVFMEGFYVFHNFIGEILDRDRGGGPVCLGESPGCFVGISFQFLGMGAPLFDVSGSCARAAR